MKINSYKEAVRYLESFIPTASYARVLDLSRFAAICELLDHPERKYPIIHVGGTSGKGSTATFSSYLLQESGLKVGLHLSPHVEHLMERIQINNVPISEQELVDNLNTLIPFFDKVAASEVGPLSYFEMLVVLAFHVFAEKKVEAAVIEVGLGGTLDATNIIPPSVSILTNVSLDHTSILGRTVGQIAHDKMGIIKSGSPGVISGITQPSQIKKLVDKCEEVHVPLYLLNKDFDLRKEKLALPGAFQKTNFALAAKATEIFLQKYFPGKLNSFEDTLQKAATKAFIPGRLEIISREPLIILDGAHNAAKTNALVSALKQLYPSKKFVSIVAIKKDKPAGQLIRLLTPITDTFLFTRFHSSADMGLHPSLHPDELAKTTKKPHQVFPEFANAIREALNLNQPILITGSLYLVGEAKKYLKENKI